jgi:hypothetical protein
MTTEWRSFRFDAALICLLQTPSLFCPIDKASALQQNSLFSITTPFSHFAFHLHGPIPSSSRINHLFLTIFN